MRLNIAIGPPLVALPKNDHGFSGRRTTEKSSKRCMTGLDPFLNLDWRWDGGLSTRHEPTGLNATVAVFSQRPQATEMREAHGFIVKLGWLAELMPIGKTAVSADIARNFNIGIDGDEGKSFGIFVLQNWDQFGIRVYVGVRQYDVDRPDISLKPLTVVPFGALLQF